MRRTPDGGRRRSFLPRLEALECRALPSTYTVLNTQDSGPDSLRDLIAGASDGDTIVFDPSLVGQTITLTSGELVLSHSLDIEGSGAGLLTISGNNQSRVFDVNNSGATVTIAGLTITHGLADNGGGIQNVGTLTLTACTISNNQAHSPPGSFAEGGGMFNTGTLTVQDSDFIGNVAMGGRGTGSNSSAGRGGGLACDQSATTTVSNCTFNGNQAIGGAGDPGVIGSNGAGAGVVNAGTAVLTVTGSTFSHNLAIGGAGGTGATGGQGSGAGLNNQYTCTVEECSFIDNQAIGGAGGAGSQGGPGYGGGLTTGSFSSSTTLTVSNSIFMGNQVFGGADGGAANGGAIVNITSAGMCTLTVSQCTFIDNEVIAGSGGVGGFNGFLGQAEGGAINSKADNGNDSATITGSLFTGNQAIGGSGGTGGGGSHVQVGVSLGGAIVMGGGSLTLSTAPLRTTGPWAAPTTAGAAQTLRKSAARLAAPFTQHSLAVEQGGRQRSGTVRSPVTRRWAAPVISPGADSPATSAPA
jgi:hypothetical protein